jgi:hypothetical protein
VYCSTNFQFCSIQASLLSVSESEATVFRALVYSPVTLAICHPIFWILIFQKLRWLDYKIKHYLLRGKEISRRHQRCYFGRFSCCWLEAGSIELIELFLSMFSCFCFAFPQELSWFHLRPLIWQYIFKNTLSLSFMATTFNTVVSFGKSLIQNHFIEIVSNFLNFIMLSRFVVSLCCQYFAAAGWQNTYFLNFDNLKRSNRNLLNLFLETNYKIYFFWIVFWS